MHILSRQHYQMPYSYCALQRTVGIRDRNLQSSNGVQIVFLVAIQCITSRALPRRLSLRCALPFDHLLRAEVKSAWGRAQNLHGLKRSTPFQCDR